MSLEYRRIQNFITCLCRLCPRRNSLLPTTMMLTFHSWRESTLRRMLRPTPPERCFSCRATKPSRCLRLSWFYHQRVLAERRSRRCLHHQKTTQQPRCICGNVREHTLRTMTSLLIKCLAICECHLPLVTSRNEYSKLHRHLVVEVKDTQLPCLDNNFEFLFSPL